ncbi:MAG: cold-shock protein [Paenalcaligenes sp.]
MKIETGIVKWFDNDRGFGFIMPENGGKDLFAHHSEIQSNGSQSTLEENQRVSYVVGQGQKGPCATKITLL